MFESSQSLWLFRNFRIQIALFSSFTFIPKTYAELPEKEVIFCTYQFIPLLAKFNFEKFKFFFNGFLVVRKKCI